MKRVIDINKTLIICLTLTLMLNFSLHAVIIFGNCTCPPEHFHAIDRMNRGIGAIIYIILSIAFIIVGYYMYKRLLDISYSKSKLMVKRIKLSILLIATPILIRALYSIVRLLIDEIDIFKQKSLQRDDFVYPIFNLFIYLSLDLIPMGLQFWCVKMVTEGVSRPQDFKPLIGSSQQTFTTMHFAKRSEDAISSNSKRTSSSINSWRNDSEGSAFRKLLFGNTSGDNESSDRLHLLSMESADNIQRKSGNIGE